MSEIEVKKDWMDYTNLAANIHQSIKLGEISNQLSQLTSINTAMLGNMNNLVNIEVYKLEQEENEKQFKQLLFNLKKFVKTKYDDPLTVALLKNGHCKMIDSLLENFQKELKSFEEKEYVENIMDSFNEYSSTDIDYKTLGEANEDDVTLLLSFLMVTDGISSKVEKITETKENIEFFRDRLISPMQRWTIDSYNEYLKKINCFEFLLDKNEKPETSSHRDELMKIFIWHAINRNEKVQFIFDDNRKIKYASSDVNIEMNKDKKVGFFGKMASENSPVSVKGTKKFLEEREKIENEILPKMIGDDQKETNILTNEVQESLNKLSDDLVKSNSEWINVERKLLDIIFDVNLAIQGPYQYRRQVING